MTDLFNIHNLDHLKTLTRMIKFSADFKEIQENN